MMQNQFKVTEFIRCVLDNLPSDLNQINQDTKKNLKVALNVAFTKLDLVPREEFELQAALLARTRALVEELEKKIEALEENNRQ